MLRLELAVLESLITAGAVSGAMPGERTGHRTPRPAGDTPRRGVPKAHAAVVRDPGMQHPAGPGAEPAQAGGTASEGAGGGMKLAYERAAGVIGSVSERTIARHLGWTQRLIAASVLEASELLAELVPFAALPEVRAGGSGLAELHRYLAAPLLTTARSRGAHHQRLPAPPSVPSRRPMRWPWCSRRPRRHLARHSRWPQQNLPVPVARRLLPQDPVRIR